MLRCRHPLRTACPNSLFSRNSEIEFETNFRQEHPDPSANHSELILFPIMRCIFYKIVLQGSKTLVNFIHTQQPINAMKDFVAASLDKLTITAVISFCASSAYVLIVNLFS